MHNGLGSDRDNVVAMKFDHLDFSPNVGDQYVDAHESIAEVLASNLVFTLGIT
jgi:hypothetical protein